MDDLFSHFTVANVQQDVLRNIVSIHTSQDLFDDLTDNPAEWALAQQVEDQIKPPPYRSATPIVDRPFEDAQWANAIGWPFKHWQASRFSDGTFGVWYGCGAVETTVYETVYHWVNGLLRDAGFEQENVAAQRKVYSVACHAALLDARPALAKFAGLIHPTDYGFAQSVGARMHREGHPGLITHSVRQPGGNNYVVMNPAVLSNPRLHCQLTYRLKAGRIVVEKQPGVTWLNFSQEKRLEVPVDIQ